MLEFRQNGQGVDGGRAAFGFVAETAVGGVGAGQRHVGVCYGEAGGFRRYYVA